MNNWLSLSIKRQFDLFNLLSAKTGLQPQAIEKDAWVSLILRLIFKTNFAEHLVFKGGTSLSKAYQLIERFSEDIDLSIDRKYFGYGEILTKGDIRRLRRKSHDFASNEVCNELKEQLVSYGVEKSLFTVEVENTQISDKDPEIVSVRYKSVFEELPYISSRVIVEIGARGLTQPAELKEITSIIDEHYKDSPLNEGVFEVRTIVPEKTFLEKLILLHEEFKRPQERIRHLRMSRHLYDIGQIINSEFGAKAFVNQKLFSDIIAHRKMFTPIKTVDYEKLKLSNLSFIPPKEFLELYRKDYAEMQENMIYGNSLNFNDLIKLLRTNYPNKI